MLYTSIGCHLCEQARAVVEPLLSQFDLELQEVEIADSEALVERYGLRIPVLRLESAQLPQLQEQEQELGWPFDAQDVVRFIQSAL